MNRTISGRISRKTVLFPTKLPFEHTQRQEKSKELQFSVNTEGLEKIYLGHCRK